MVVCAVASVVGAMCEDGRHAAKKFGVRDEPRIDGNAACVRNRPGPPVGNRSSPYGGRRPPTHLPLLHLPRRKLATDHRSRLLQIKNAPSQARLTRSKPPPLRRSTLPRGDHKVLL